MFTCDEEMMLVEYMSYNKNKLCEEWNGLRTLCLCNNILSQHWWLCQCVYLSSLSSFEPLDQLLQNLLCTLYHRKPSANSLLYSCSQK